MPKPVQPPLSLSDCLCPICREILLEPVTLPCNHTLCSPCFQMTVEKASLSCPMCRRRVSTWARLNARAKTLINVELWERIQREFPNECQRRANGQDSEDLEEMCTSYPAPQVSKPGELRQEYEQEVSKLEAERRAREEEESKASEALIQRLLAEEEAEQRRAALRRQVLEEQLVHDEQLAQMLSSDLVSSGESSKSSEGSSPVSKIPKASKSKPRKATKNKQSQPANIERFLTAVPSCSSSLLLPPEAENGHTMPETAEHRFRWVNGSLQLEDEEMPVLYPQETSIPPTKNAVLRVIMPKLSPKAGMCSPGEDSFLQRLSGAAKGRTEEDLFLTRIAIDRKCWSEKLSTADTLDTKENSKRKCVESSQEVCRNLCPEGKKRRKLLEPATMECDEMALDSGDSSPGQRLVDLEKDMYDRWQQEEQDRLLAVQIQKELDKEQSQVNRQKGSPDGYPLRRRPSTNAAELETALPQEQTIHGAKKSVKKQTYQAEEGLPKSRCDSPDENKKPSSESRPVSPANASLHRKNRKASLSPLLDGGKILQSSNKQPTILQMFQRSAAK